MCKFSTCTFHHTYLLKQANPMIERKMMYQKLCVGLAVKLGLHPAVAAQCLIDGIEGVLDVETTIARGDLWVRMGHRSLTLHAPFLTPDMAKSALRKLVKAGICRTMKLSDSSFDHTYWYSFTDYGNQLMQAVSDIEY
jgi:hypothetical protein